MRMRLVRASWVDVSLSTSLPLLALALPSGESAFVHEVIRA